MGDSRKSSQISCAVKLKVWKLLHAARIRADQGRQRSGCVPLLILASGRSGSSWLVSCLNSVPRVRIVGEVLNPDFSYGPWSRRTSKAAVLRHLIHSVHAAGASVSGVKLLQYHLDMYGVTAGDLRRLFPLAKYLILYRRSLLEQYLSLRIARQTGQWRGSENFHTPPLVHVDPAALKTHCEDTKRFYGRILGHAWLKGCSEIICYEEMLEDVQRVFDTQIFPLLKLPRSGVSSAFVKQNTERSEKIIANYGEIRSIAESGLARQGYTHCPGG